MKSTHKQNLTGNRYHAPVDPDYYEKFASILARKIVEAGHWKDIDIESIKKSYPGLWGLTCKKARVLKAEKGRQASKAREKKLRQQCNSREQSRFTALRVA